MAAGIGEAGMTLIGAAFGLAGKKPVVPPAPTVDAGVAQATAIKQDIGALPGIEKLTSQFDTFSVDELMKTLEQFSPGISESLSKIPGVLGSEVAGQVPADVQRMIKQSVGAKAFAAGLSPGQRANMEAEQIGQTSYQIQQQGITAAERWMATVEGILPHPDFASMFVTTAQQIATDEWNATNRFNRDWMANKIAAMPSPTQQAAMGAMQSFGSLVDQYGGAALGMMGGGGGMGGMMGMMGGGGGSGGNSSGSFNPSAAYDMMSLPMYYPTGV